MDLVWITRANYLKEFEIELEFNDGTIGVVNLKNKLIGQVFEPLQDVKFFKDFKLNSWTLEWSNGADLAPEFLYQEAVKNKVKLTKI
jgi:hypothetical protein